MNSKELFSNYSACAWLWVSAVRRHRRGLMRSLNTDKQDLIATELVNWTFLSQSLDPLKVENSSRPSEECAISRNIPILSKDLSF